MVTDAEVNRVTFGLFEADLQTGELWKAGYRIKLPRQPFRVLAALIKHPGDIVTREDIQREIWGEHTNVDFDQAIAAAINKVREALGDSADDPRYIQTLPKRGYRFIAPVARAQWLRAEPEPEKAVDKIAVGSAQSAAPSFRAMESQAADARTSGPLLSEALTHEQVATPSLTPSILAPQVVESRQTGAADSTQGRSPQGLRTVVLYSCLLLAAATAIAFSGRLFLQKGDTATPFRIDQVTHYVPISLGPPNPESFLDMAMDGERVLTSVIVDGLPRLSAIDVATGEVQRIAVPNEIASNSLADISKDGSKLLLRSQQSTESEQPLWVVPTAGGSGRRIPGVLAHDAAWMPNAAGILYATGNDLAELSPDEESSTAFAKLPGRAFWLRWSPDGKVLRFTLFDPIRHSTALWEIEGQSHQPKPVHLPDVISQSACCGVWLSDARSYVFQANNNLWLLQGTGRSARLVQLTNGPLRFLSPVATRSGGRIFFVGLEAPSGLQQFDPERKEFRSASAFLADATRIDFSRDGKWVAWTDIHEKLWRARADGSDKLRLTSDALEVFLAQWSPDGTRLAVMARKPGGVWQIYLVDASGGKAEAFVSETRNAADPGWSADGSSLVFGREPDLMGKETGSHTLQIVNTLTRQVEPIPNSEGLFSPRWSPDGRWIVALTSDQKGLMLYNVSLHRWQRLASTSAADPVWSADSKAVYVHAFLADREPLLRIAVPTGTIETVASLDNFHNGEAANYFFGGVTPQGAPLVQPRVGTGNLYTLDLTTP